MSSTTKPTTAFDDVPRLHGDALYKCALQLTCDRSAALDLVQDTYERALRRGLDGVPPENVRGWLVVIARNQFVDNYRAHKRSPITSELHVPEPMAPDPDGEETSPWSSIRVADVRRVLGRLSPTLLGVFRLHAFEGLHYAAISERLGIPISTVGTRLRRARLQLRHALLRECATCLPLIPRASRARAARAPGHPSALRLANS
jgi:RNA polymerase sigma-70 factor (ECF subfamily)